MADLAWRAVHVLHLLRRHCLPGEARALGPELDCRAIVVANEVDRFAVIGVATGEVDAAVVRAGDFNLGRVQDGVEVSGNGDNDTIAGGEQIDGAPGAPLCNRLGRPVAARVEPCRYVRGQRACRSGGACQARSR